jgi:hypothetical protein
MIEQGFKIAFAVYHSQNEHLAAVHAINDDVLPRETPRTGSEFFIAGAAGVRGTLLRKRNDR